MSASRLLLLRLVALGFALVGTGVGGPAPQAWRAWVDVAALVDGPAPANEIAARDEAAESDGAHATADAARASDHLWWSLAPFVAPFVARFVAPSPFATASVCRTSAWPTSASGRDVLAHKHALLI